MRTRGRGTRSALAAPPIRAATRASAARTSTRPSARSGRASRPSRSTQCGNEPRDALPQGCLRDAGGERLAVAPPPAQAWPAEPRPHAPHPVAGAALLAWEGARRHGIEMRVGPVAITNGRFGNRPHCIYRGFCLQGCKVHAKASPLITHLPDALAHGAEIRADAMVSHVEIDDGSGAATGVRYLRDGEERVQRAAAVAVAGYSIETPRLLLRSTGRRHPNGIGNHSD